MRITAGVRRPSKTDGGRRLGEIGFGLAIAGRAAFLVTETVAITTGELPEAVMPVAVTLTVAGMTLAGVAIARHGTLGSWRRYAEVHSGREASWARSRSAAEVVARLDAGHAVFRSLLESLRADELTDDRYRNYVDHMCTEFDAPLRGAPRPALDRVKRDEPSR